MRILVLGGSGMLGHKVYQILRTRYPLTACSLRGSLNYSPLRSIDFFERSHVFEGFDAADLQTQKSIFGSFRPEVVVNCIGLIKQRPAARSTAACMAVNGTFPRKLEELTAEFKARLIHFSTDCVFSGCRGGYTEDDPPDANDPYGISKIAGEVAAPHVLTLRTSFVGRELATFASLLEWFLARDGESLRGYTRAMFSGVTSNYLGRLIAEIVDRHAGLSGLYHLASPAISKHDLLCLLKKAYGINAEIIPDDTVQCDRSLIGRAFTAKTGISVPSWPELVRDMCEDPTPYDRWRIAYETA